MRMPTCSLSSLSISISKLHLPSFAAANYTTKNMAIAAALSVANGACQAYLESKFVRENKEGVAELCRHFYTKRWVSGTGASVTMNVHDDSIPKSQQLIVISPSSVQKERMLPEDMYVLSSTGCILSTPSPKPYPHKHPKCIDCAPLFMEAGRYHYLFDAAIRNFQLGLYWSVPSHGPIQRVFAHQRNTNMTANAAVNLKNAAEPSHHCIVLDIEGTTTPISFVTDSLFPYAHDNVGKHLYLTYDTEETQDDIKLLRAQVDEDLRKGVADAVPIPTSDAGKDEVIASLVANVEAMINADRKVTALKQLQGHIWRTGFQNNELQGVVFDDVPDALQKWHASGIKVYIYSSGSREAQRLIFGNSNHGDLRKYLCGYFDTAVGNKKETRSYLEISQSLGVDEPSDILFVTDVIQEAVAAKAAGLEVIISVRPGNAPIPENHGFKTVRTLLEI